MCFPSGDPSQATLPDLQRLIAAASAAGASILGSFGGVKDHETKKDRSPVTEADREAERIIARLLRADFPAVPVVAEEAIAEGHVPPHLGSRFFLVDPLDGTREFIAGRPDFTVNIALVEDGRPRWSVVFAPAHGEMFLGCPAGAFKARADATGLLSPFVPITVRPCPARPVALASRSHRTADTDRHLARYDLDRVVPLGSSLKFCRIAEGQADLYPCLGPTMEWDTAAGEAVLEAAGGSVRQLDGRRLAYGQRGRGDQADFANPHFLALGSPS